MKRYGKSECLWERICSDETIERAMRHSLIKHKYPHMPVADYNKAQKYMIAHWDECKELVLRTLTSESYQFNGLHPFKVYEPKERTINCPEHYPDKIIMICAYMVLRDYFYSKFVRNTYNCVKGRGIHDAKRAIERIMRQHPDWYYVQTDIQKFYPSLRHDIIKSDLRTVFKDVHVLKLLDAIVDVFHESVDAEGHEIGIAIGINLSQLMAILVNMPIIRAINERWKYPTVNFTDDEFTAVPTKAKAHEFVEWYIDICATRGLRVKPNYRIAPMREPVRMIGYKFCLDKDGRQYTLLSKDIKIRMKRRVKQLAKQNLSDDDWKQQMAFYYGWCKHACCKNLMRKTYGDKYNLFDKNMQTLQDIKEGEVGEFGVLKRDRLSVTLLIGKPICFEDAKIVEITNTDMKTGEKKVEKKLAAKFRHVENGEPVGEASYFISGSPSLRDRVMDMQGNMPFIASIVMQGCGKRYYAIK